MNHTEDKNERLIEAARNALPHSKSQYSNFRVGAAIRCKDGAVYSGCNIESASYGLTICAERCALFKALSEGCKRGDFEVLAIAVEGEAPVMPCGACRQVISEWAPDIEIISVGSGNTVEHRKIAELLPYPFDPNVLGEKFKS